MFCLPVTIFLGGMIEKLMPIILYYFNQVILYKLSSEVVGCGDVMKKWVYVGYVRAHTHDVRALTVAVPISREGGHFFFSFVSAAWLI